MDASDDETTKAPFEAKMPRPSLVPQVTAQILDQIREGRLIPGQHLPSQTLADSLRVSRAPINAALRELERSGVVRSEPNRGYFLSDAAGRLAEIERSSLPAADAEDATYLKIAEDRLDGKLADRVSEAELMRLYDVPRIRLAKILYRIAEEGWAERLPGNGWAFGPMLNSRDAYEQAYQFRASIEWEAMRLPSFKLDEQAFNAARQEQERILRDHLTMSRAEIFHSNCAFHEMLIACSGNDFFLSSLKRVNRLRRLIEYRITIDRSRLPVQSREHLALLDLLASGHREAAAVFLRQHVLGACALKSPQVGGLGGDLPLRII